MIEGADLIAQNARKSSIERTQTMDGRQQGHASALQRALDGRRGHPAPQAGKGAKVDDHRGHALLTESLTQTVQNGICDDI